MPTCALACDEFERLFGKEKSFKRALESDDEDVENDQSQIGKKVKTSNCLSINSLFPILKLPKFIQVSIGVYKHQLAFVSIDCSTYETNGKR